jgi:drug/metabolite transporter (DMT)-like permease
VPVLAIALAFASSLCWGTADFMGGLQARRRALVTVLLVSQVAALALALAFLAASADPLPDLGPLALAAGAGVAGCAALAAFYRGLAIGTMSIVAPVSATGAVVPVLVGVASGERPGTIQVAGIALAMIGIVLAAREPVEEGAVPKPAVRASIGLALLAAAGFGTFFVLIDSATEDAGAPWALLAVRVADVLVLGTAALLLRPALASGVRDAAPLLVLGSLDFLATALFALATQEGLLSVVSVVGSLYPAVTVVLARIVLSERVARSQEVGVAITLAGVIAISAG